MPSNKNQHFVPQFFLRNFAVPGEKCIRTYNIAARRHIDRAAIATQCSRDYLYGRDLELERAFASLEREAADAIRAVIAQRFHHPTIDQLRILLSFVALQYGRTPKAAAEFNLTATKWMQNVMRSHPAPPEGLLENIDKIRMEHEHALDFAIQSTYRGWPVLADLDLVVLVNRTEIEFVASDVPVVLHNQWNQDIAGVGVIGFACTGLQVFLPVSPAHTLLFYDPDIYEVAGSRRFCDVRDPRLVKQLNALQAMEAEANLYYRSAATTSAIDDLPWHLRRGPDDAVESFRLVQEGGTRQLVMHHRRMSAVKLASPVITVRAALRDVPRQQRAMSWRPVAMEMSDRISGDRPERPSGIPSGTTFVRVQDHEAGGRSA